jgi:2-hydroxychromene-2-carboxylate isomerase
MAQKTIDYYLAPQSPWTYLGHARLVTMAKKFNAKINVKPIDLGKIFPVSGGLPLPKRAPQRQAYRLLELDRFRQHLRLPLNPHPAFFPVAGDPAARIIIAAQAKHSWKAGLAFAHKVLSGVWAEQRNIADEAALKEMLQECDLPESLYEVSQTEAVQAEYDQYTQEAIDLQVFGSPSYVVSGELFWGQDRLDFVERKLATSPF